MQATTFQLRTTRSIWSVVALCAIGSPLVGQVLSTPVPIPASYSPFQRVVPALEGDTIHLVVAPYALQAHSLYIRSPDRGRTWSLPSGLGDWVGAIASSGPRVYLFGGSTVMTSQDDGITWQSSPHPTGATVSAVHAEGLECHIVCNSGGSVSYAHTLDGGATWSASALLGQSATVAPRLFVSGSTILAFWQCQNQANAGTYYQRSIDGGVTWLPSQQSLGSAPASMTADQVVCSGQHVHVLRGYQPTEYLHSPDAGSTWLTPLAPGPGWYLAAAGSSVYIASSGPQLSVLRSQDDGTTWSASPIGPGSPFGAAIAASGSVVCFAWSEAAGARRIATSVDLGATWQVAVAGNGGYYSQRGYPVLSLRPPAVAALWLRADYFFVPYVWYPSEISASSDNGLTWPIQQTFGWGPAWFLDGPETANVLLGTSAQASTSWLQSLSYATVYGYERFGPSKVGTGSMAPSMQLTGVPCPGSTLTLTVAGTVGATTAMLAVGFTGEAATPLGSGQLLVDSPALAVWGITSGSSGAAGAGSMPVPFAIPNSPSLHRQRVTFQGFALDANAADGFASTAGLTMVVL